MFTTDYIKLLISGGKYPFDISWWKVLQEGSVVILRVMTDFSFIQFWKLQLKPWLSFPSYNLNCNTVTFCYFCGMFWKWLWRYLSDFFLAFEKYLTLVNIWIRHLEASQASRLKKVKNSCFFLTASQFYCHHSCICMYFHQSSFPIPYFQCLQKLLWIAT